MELLQCDLADSCGVAGRGISKVVRRSRLNTHGGSAAAGDCSWCGGRRRRRPAVVAWLSFVLVPPDALDLARPLLELASSISACRSRRRVRRRGALRHSRRARGRSPRDRHQAAGSSLRTSRRIVAPALAAPAVVVRDPARRAQAVDSVRSACVPARSACSSATSARRVPHFTRRGCIARPRSIPLSLLAG